MRSIASPPFFFFLSSFFFARHCLARHFEPVEKSLIRCAEDDAPYKTRSFSFGRMISAPTCALCLNNRVRVSRPQFLISHSSLFILRSKTAAAPPATLLSSLFSLLSKKTFTTPQSLKATAPLTRGAVKRFFDFILYRKFCRRRHRDRG